MNIWLINHYAVPTKYYPLTRPASFAKYLMRAGHEVTIFAASTVHNSAAEGGFNQNLIPDGAPYAEDTVDGIHYVYVKAPDYAGNGLRRIINMLVFPARLPKVCKRFPKPDAILSVSVTPLACMAGLKLGKKYGCGAVAEIADLWPESFVAYGMIGQKNPLLKRMYAYEKKLYTRADAIVFTMEGGRDYIIEKGWDRAHGGPVDLEKVFHINNGADMEVFRYNREHYAYADPDLDDADTFKAVYTGSVRLTNHVDRIVEAAELLKQNTRIKFLIFGDGDKREELRQSCIDKGLTNVRFYGKVDKLYIPSIVSKADVCVTDMVSSELFRYGISPNKLFDYIASGKPIISGLQCNYDIIEKLHLGITVPEISGGRIADAVLQFAEMSADERERYRANVAGAREQYDFKNLTDRLLEVIRYAKRA